MKKVYLFCFFLLACSQEKEHDSRVFEVRYFDLSPEAVTALIESSYLKSRGGEKKLVERKVAEHQSETLMPFKALQKRATLTFNKGDNLESLLTRYEMSARELYYLSQALEPYLPTSEVRVGQQVKIEVNAGKLVRLVFPIGFAEQLVLSKVAEKWKSNLVALPTNSEYRSLSGEITGSFYKSALRYGVPISVINQFIMAHSHHVDFQRDLKFGDRFSLIYLQEYLVEDKAKFRAGQLKYAELLSADRLSQLFHYKDSSGFSAFYLETGLLAESFLLKTPIEGASLSSVFGPRMHPVLGYSRLHKGLDFSAPIGSPVLAAGAGVVDYVGRYGSFGNLVKIKHRKGYHTFYAHLQKFAQDLEKGNQVKQGQLIGFLGKTGLSQGRHLHYEIHRDGKAINPTKIKQPVSIRLSEEELGKFQQYKKKLAQYLPVRNKTREEEIENKLAGEVAD